MKDIVISIARVIHMEFIPMKVPGGWDLQQWGGGAQPPSLGR